MAHVRGKMRPPTGKWGSTYCSSRLGTPRVKVSALAAGAGPADAPAPADVAAPPAADVVPPEAAVVAGELPLLSLPHPAATSADNASMPLPVKSERREKPNPKVPGMIASLSS